MNGATTLKKLLVLDTCNMRDALRVIDQGGRGIVFVVDVESHLRGVVTDGDIRRAILSGFDLDTTVTQFMTKEPKIVRAGTSREEILKLMTDVIKHMPVTDEANRVVDYVAFSQAVHLPIAAPSFSGNELRYVTECVLTNWISSQGRFVTEFEESFAKFCGTRHGVAVSNGTVALHLALVLAGVGPADEVIVPTLTFIATANAARYTGATPVFVDSEPETWNLDPREVERKITPRTKAIVAVHLYGCPANLGPLQELADKHGLLLVEDAAEAHGATYNGARVGSIGNVGCFSFFANKIVTTGEGGMLTISDDRLAEQARLLRDHGMSRTKKYWHETIGYNYRLTNLQAAIGVAQLEQINKILMQRARIADLYRSRLGHDGLEMPVEPSWGRRICWVYTLLLPSGCDRDRVIRQLQDRGIDTRPVFYPIHLMPPYQTGEKFPIAESIAARGISLPSSSDLQEGDIGYICDSLLECL